MRNIEDLYKFANKYPKKEFLVAYTVDVNLNGYSVEEMVAFFSMFEIPENIVFNAEFANLIPSKD